MTVFCLVFAIQTVIILIGGISPKTFEANITALFSVYLILDMMAIVVVMRMFQSVITMYAGLATRHSVTVSVCFLNDESFTVTPNKSSKM